MTEKEDRIDRGRLQQSLEQWEKEAKEKHQKQEEADHSAPVLKEKPVVTEKDTDQTALPEGHTELAHTDVDDSPKPPKQQKKKEKKRRSRNSEEKTQIVKGEHLSSGKEKPTSGAANEETKQRTQSTGSAFFIRLPIEILIFAVFLFLSVSSFMGYSFMDTLLRRMDGAVGGLAVFAGLLLISGLIALPTLVDGFVSLFTLRKRTTSTVALAYLGAIAGLVSFGLNHAHAQLGLLLACSGLACLCLEMVAQVLSRYAKLVNKKTIKTSRFSYPAFIARMTDHSHGKSIICPGTAVYVDHAEDDAAIPTGRIASIVSLVVLIIAVISAFISGGMLHRPLWQALLLGGITACGGTPLFMGLGAILPFSRCARPLKKLGAALSGFGAVHVFGQTNALLLPEDQIYPKGQVRIRALRPFCDGEKIEEALLMAASVASIAKMAMAPAILSLFNEGESILLPVERMRVNEEVGAEAQVNGKVLILGSRNLMRQRGIDLTGRMLLEVEAKYAVEGNDFVYLAIEDKLAALLVLNYIPKRSQVFPLQNLEKSGLRLYISSVDANINKDQIAADFHLKKQTVVQVPHRQVEKLIPAELDGGAALFAQKSATSLAGAVSACVRMDSVIRAVSVMQVIAALAGTALVLFLYFFYGRLMGSLGIVIMQGIWTLPSFFIAFFRRYL